MAYRDWNSRNNLPWSLIRGAKQMAPRHRCFQGVSGREIERGKVEGGEGKESGRFEILLYFYTQKLSLSSSIFPLSSPPPPQPYILLPPLTFEDALFPLPKCLQSIR